MDTWENLEGYSMIVNKINPSGEDDMKIIANAVCTKDRSKIPRPHAEDQAVKAPRFLYARPTTVAETLELLSTYGDECRSWRGARA